MSRRKRKKTKSKAKAKEPKINGAPKYKRAKTANGQRIQSMLLSLGWDPGRYKDYVVIFGTVLLDWKDRYEATRTDGSPLTTNQILAVHKSKLHGMIPDKIASLFWHKSTGTRVVKAGPR